MFEAIPPCSAEYYIDIVLIRFHTPQIIGFRDPPSPYAALHPAYFTPQYFHYYAIQVCLLSAYDVYAPGFRRQYYAIGLAYYAAAVEGLVLFIALPSSSFRVTPLPGSPHRRQPFRHAGNNTVTPSPRHDNTPH
jgi:hypothetical protein